MPYDQRYELELMRGIEENRPWNLIEEIKKYTKKSDILLDIGCGTTFKLTHLINDVNKVYGLEPNKNMLDKAKENIKNHGLNNLILVKGCAENIPFKNDSFNIITCMVAPHNASEIYRVLKPNSYCILEKIGDMDKWNVIQEFECDEKGGRGMYYGYKKGELTKIYEKEFKNLFSKVYIKTGFWTRFYTIEGLILLLEQTPSIRGFNKDYDKDIIKKIQGKYTTDKGIKIYQNRILITAKK